MNTLKKITTPLVLTSLLVVMLSGCTKPEGPAEKAGKAVDNAVNKTGQQIEKAGDQIQDKSNGKTP
ncbi:MAG: hypothetical protein JXK51_04545 [Halothiobacillaceae bacterium]|nr:hypothetical protein [Halothiobacillaceae bacterium]